MTKAQDKPARDEVPKLRVARSKLTIRVVTPAPGTDTTKSKQ